ncbi:histidine phosphatase family protein [Olsenella urininfantis]|uniref:histidine phosphatase family protein n=1 Tax=Olsenella urininfantis TaxID=1871033 RepID=UPI0009862BA5|nr:histidine phosphatase family protein [Olsenella urininfantis]
MPARQQVLLMRHPQTFANTEHFLSGRKDVELTQLGVSQMYEAIGALAAWRPDRIWCSPLARCRAIAEEVAAALGLSCEVHEELAEIEFGSVQDWTHERLVSAGYSFPWPFDDAGRSLPAPGAESFEELVERARLVLDELRPLSGRTACITHGGFTRALIGAALDTPLTSFWNLQVRNVSSQIMSCDGRRFALEALGLRPEELRLRSARAPLDEDFWSDVR